MNKYKAYWPLDDAPQGDGDALWRGVNNKLHPSGLEDGLAADAVNLRFDIGKPATRKGARINAWASNWQVGDAQGIIRPFGEVLTAGNFSNPISGFDWQVIVATKLDVTKAFRARPGNFASEIPVEAGQDITSSVDLLQTYNGLLLLRGKAAQPLVLTNLDEGFKSIPAASEGRVAMPPLTQAIYMQNRVIGVDGRTGAYYSDSFWVSDIGDVSTVLQGEDVYQNFKINRGSADRLVAGFKFNDFTILALKRQSVHVISEVYGTNAQIQANAKLDTVTDEYGCIAPRSIVQVGHDVWFLGDGRGVCSIRQTEQNKLQGVDAAKSLDIEGWVARINWQAAGDACAATLENKVYFAVPIDGATYNNAILVYSTLNQKWVSLDTGPAIKVKEWAKYEWQGKVRLGFVSTDGFIYLYEDGYMDHTGTSEGVITYSWIPTRFASRGLGGRTEGFKNFQRWTLNARVWSPTYTLNVSRDGVFEVESARTVTKDRTTYNRPYGREDYDPVDPDDDWSQPHRQDYSVAQPFSVRAPGTGAAFDVLEENEETGRIRNAAQWVQLVVESTTGRVEIGGISVEPTRGSTADGSRD